MNIEAHAPDGVGEVTEGSDLAGLVSAALDLRDGDIVVITSKVVSKAEGRVVAGDREAAIEAETVRLVARRGTTSIVENHLGLIMAAAGVDASNVEGGRVVLLPTDPDRSARSLRAELARQTGANVAVLISDTSGRPWREGQTDIAIGCAGLQPVQSFAGSQDTYGNPLAVTAPAIADEIAGLAELASGKLGGRPFTRIRGLSGRVLAPGVDGPGAVALLRPRAGDMFALGTREAVEAALRGDLDSFGTAATPEELNAAMVRCGIDSELSGTGADAVLAVADELRLPQAEALACAHGWKRVDNSLRFQPHL